MIDNRQIAAAMSVRLDQVFGDLPTMPSFVDGIRRAPKRQFSLSRRDTELALKNALRYVPEEWHPALAPEFLNELLTRGRIYGYRFRPEGRIRGRPIDSYQGQLSRRPCLSGHDRQQSGLRDRPVSLRTRDLRGDRSGLSELDAVPPDQTLPGNHDP